MVYLYVYENELNETSQIIAVVQHSKREEFETTLQALCTAMGWQRTAVKTYHMYLNSVIDRFPIL